MIMPPLQGNSISSDCCVFIAADENYFNLYAKSLVNSIKKHIQYPIHLHLYNPSNETKNWCDNKSVSFSFEEFDPIILEPTFDKWVLPQTDPLNQKKKNDMTKDPTDHTRLRNEILKTYYACTRFIRLASLIKKPTYIIMLDTDSIIRDNFILPTADVDIHIFEKKHKKHVPWVQHLASTIFYTGTSNSFNLIQEHSTLIQEVYDRDEIYWFLDRDSLDVAIQKGKKRPLSVNLVDFNMSASSPIWCAKGPRKFQDIYLKEIKKYS
jgi:hypothetical protein